MPASRPHIIYILSDEHRGQAMSHMGDPNIRTPVMDRLAEEGASFERAYANCPICTPSRGTIFSGRHAHAGPVSGFFDVYKASAPSSATILRENGYHTAYFGKWHCGVYRNQVPDHPEFVKATPWPHRAPENHRAGFQDWCGFEIMNNPFNSYYFKGSDTQPTRMEGYQTDALTNLAIEYIRNYDREEPLFLVLSVETPHFTLEAPEKFKRFDPARLQVRPNFGRPLDILPSPVASDAKLRESLATYYAMIENLDWNIGRMTEAIRGVAGFENTLTVYFSDHGEYMGSHGLTCAKERPHEESVRIPAIFQWPGQIPARGLIPGLFSLVDMLPTTLGLANVPVPSHIQGANFAPALLGKQFDGPRQVLLEMVNNPRWALQLQDWRGLVTERWKYTFYETGQELLYDLENDPYEIKNLAATNPAECEKQRRALLTLLAQSREPYFDVLIEHGVTPEGPVVDIDALKRR